MTVALGRIQISVTVQERPARQRDHALATPAHRLTETAHRIDSLLEATSRVDASANVSRAYHYERPGCEVEIMPCPDGSWRPLFKTPGSRRRDL